MARWPNGGPRKLWVVVVNSLERVKNRRMLERGLDAGSVLAFDDRPKRKAWLVTHFPTYSSHDVTLLEYVQKGL